MGRSKEMKEIVAIHVKGPGGYGMEVRDIKLREPDPALFYPPAATRSWPRPIIHKFASYAMRATAGMRRSAAAVTQLSPSAPRKTMVNFAYPGSDAGSSAYCSQLTNM